MYFCTNSLKLAHNVEVLTPYTLFPYWTVCRLYDRWVRHGKWCKWVLKRSLELTNTIAEVVELTLRNPSPQRNWRSKGHTKVGRTIV